MLWRQGRTPAENEGGTGSPLGLVVTWVPPGWHVISWLFRSMRRVRANRSRTSWRSNTSGFSTAAPRRTGRSSSPPRQRLRPHGFLLRPSTAAVLQPAFVDSSAFVGGQLFAPASSCCRPSRISVLKGSEIGGHQRPRLPSSARHTPNGRSASSDLAPTGVSSNHGRAHAAQPNPSMQRTRYARR